MKSICSILTILLLLTAGLATPSAVAVTDACRSDCCEHTTHRSDHCTDCVVCVTGLSYVLPAVHAQLPDERVVLARLDWLVFAGEIRTDPPLLLPPRRAG